MNILFTRLLCPGLLLLTCTVVSAQESAATFKPYALNGRWQFTNSQTRVTYGGDIKVQTKSINSTGVMRGVISYDGRQTNDNCSTRGVFSDTAVDADLTKTEKGYKISFKLSCVGGESPRAYDWTLLCKANASLQTTALAHGNSEISLTEQR